MRLKEPFPPSKCFAALKLCLVFIALFLSACSGRIEPAPVLSLSTKTASPQNLTEISGEQYTVQPGDTLFAVAFYSGNDYRDLARLNNIRPPYTINVGQTLRLSDIKNNVSNSSKNSKNLALAQNNKESNPKTLDRKNIPAYGGDKERLHRKNQQDHKKSSKNSNNDLSWEWPALGSHTIAKVGSDGSRRGLDIRGRRGSPITAAASGKVVYAGNALKGYGNLIIIKHNDQYLSAYAHNDKILVGERAYVTKGQKIATMGDSGASFVMLHFEIRKRGRSIDPLKYLPPQ